MLQAFIFQCPEEEPTLRYPNSFITNVEGYSDMVLEIKKTLKRKNFLYFKSQRMPLPFDVCLDR